MYIAILICYLTILICSMTKRFTKPVLFLGELIVSCFAAIVLKTNWQLIWGIATILLFLFSMLFVLKSKLDFQYRIVSIRRLINQRKKTAKENSVILGRAIAFNKDTLKHDDKLLELDERSRCGQTIICGVTGSGKTVSALGLLYQDIDQDRSIEFFDFKDDKKNHAKIIEYAERNGYDIFNLSDGDFYFDPLKDLSGQGRQEAIINSRQWSDNGNDAYYKSSTQLCLAKIYEKYISEHNWDIEEFIDFCLSFQDKSLPNDGIQSLQTIVKNIRDKNIYSTDRTREYQLGQPKTLLIVGVGSDEKERAGAISSFYFRSIISYGTQVGYTPCTGFYIDEFGSLKDSTIVKDILEKGRSMGIMTCLILQDIYQLIINTSEAYLMSILGTVNNFIIFAGVTKDAATKLSGVQIKEVEEVLQSLKMPQNGKPPIAVWLSKLPILDKKSSSEVIRFSPGSKVYKGNLPKTTNKDDKPSAKQNPDDMLMYLNEIM